MLTILLVEDDDILQKTICNALEKQNYLVCCASNVEEALKSFSKHIDFVILDIWLPDGNGISLCKEIRKISNLPILFLTANNQESTVVDGLNAGGDDYMTKPFSLVELFARINALLRRIHTTKTTIGELDIDLDNYKIRKNNKEIYFTAIEYAILFSFIKYNVSILTRNQLLDTIEEHTGNIVEDNTLSVHIKRIRDKLGTYHNKHYIETIRGVGYRIYEDK